MIYHDSMMKLSGQFLWFQLVMMFVLVPFSEEGVVPAVSFSCAAPSLPVSGLRCRVWRTPVPVSLVKPPSLALFARNQWRDDRYMGLPGKMVPWTSVVHKFMSRIFTIEEF